MIYYIHKIIFRERRSTVKKGIYTRYKERLVEIGGKSKCLYMKSVVRKAAYDMGRIFINAGDWDDCAVAQFRRALKNNTNWITQVTEHEAPLQATIDAINQSFGY